MSYVRHLLHPVRRGTPPAHLGPGSWTNSTTSDLRPDSIRGYKTAVAALRRTVPGLTGPAGVTAEVAHRFKREFLSGTYARGKASDARTYKRSPTSCRSYQRSLRSLWSKHFKPLGYIKDNPWLDVPYPNTPRGRRVRVPSEEVVNEFFAWLAKKHPGWDLPRLFVTVKMLAGCRTLDLCKAKTADLGRDSLTLAAEATKTREARTVPLPADVVADLRRAAGPKWCGSGRSRKPRRTGPTQGPSPGPPTTPQPGAGRSRTCSGSSTRGDRRRPSSARTTFGAGLHAFGGGHAVGGRDRRGDGSGPADGETLYGGSESVQPVGHPAGGGHPAPTQIVGRF